MNAEAGLDTEVASRPVIWLASYPKSGNTWLRSLFNAYGVGRSTREAQVSIDDLGGEISSSRTLLDASLGISTVDLLRDEIRELLPCAYRTWVRRLPSSSTPIVVKVHDAYAFTSGLEPVYPLDVTRAIVHIVRDPRDVAVSAHHHWNLSLDGAIARLSNIEQWVADHSVVSGQVPQWLSDWSTHALGWSHAEGARITFRYEDLLASPVEQFSRVLHTCGVDVDPYRVALAVESCRIDVLREQERKNGFRERRRESTAPFFREGRAGGWRDVLSPAQVARIVERHETVMRHFGYVE